MIKENLPPTVVEVKAEGVVLLNNQAKVSRKIKALEDEDEDEEVTEVKENPMDKESI